MGDAGSSMVRPPSYVTPLEGLTARYPQAQVLHVEADDPQAAAEAAAKADVAVVVAGFTKHDEGEWVGTDTMTNPVLRSLYPPLPEGASEPVGDAKSIMTDGYGGDRAALDLHAVDEEIITAVTAAKLRDRKSVV